MNNEELQKHLLYIAKIEVQDYFCKKLKWVTAIWKNDTAHLSFYFDKQPTEDEIEEFSCIATQIIAHMPKGFLQENYITIDDFTEKPINFLVYSKK